jgi:Flp pilus assembly protein TadD
MQSSDRIRAKTTLGAMVFSLLFWTALMCPQAGTAQVALNPTVSTGEQYHAHALELAAAGDDSGAGPFFFKAWQEDPSESRFIHDLTVYYIHHHRYSEALSVIKDSVKRLGPTASAWTLQGELLFEEKKYDPAYQSLSAALDISNFNYRAHELIGLIFSINRRYSLGLEELKIAARQNPESAQVHFYCGRLHYRNFNYASARDELLECLKLQPEYPEALENLGLAYEALGDDTTAVIQYRKAIDLERTGKVPRSELGYVCLGVLLSKQGVDEEALRLLREAVAKNANSAWAHFELGRLYFNAGQDALAEQHLKRSARLDLKYSRPHFFLGRLYARAHRQPESKAAFATFQELNQDPDNREPQMTR